LDRLTPRVVTATVPREVAPSVEIESSAARSAAPARSGGVSIAVKGVSKVFLHGGREIHVLRDINLTLGAGEIATVVGASGVGKSTLLQIVGTLDTPSSGALLFDGQDITKKNPRQLAEFRNREIGFVFQFHHLLPEFTAVENTMMPCLIGRTSTRLAREKAEAMLVRVGLAERLTHRPGELSGGEQQRVALARALVMRPRLLLADEPSGNLDTRTGDAIHELFFDINREMGMTILLVTHNASLAARAPRRLSMRDGSLEEGASA